MESANRRQARADGVLFLVFYAGLMGCTALLVSPCGDFPLNDDWIFADLVRTLLSEGRLILHPFSAPLAAAQVLYGGIFASVFGFSFTVLRVSTVLLAPLTAWAAAQCASEMGASRRASLLAGAVVMVNPIFLNLSYTFNTDAPFLAPLAFSTWFYLRACRTERAMDVAIGTAFAVVAFFIRQFGVVPSVVYGVVAVLAFFRGRRMMSWKAFLGLGIPWIGALAGYVYLRMASPATYTWPQQGNTQLAGGYISGLLLLMVTIAIYEGLFVLPLTILRFGQLVCHPGQWRRGSWMLAGLLGVVSVYMLTRVSIGVHHLPLLQNHMRDLGLGPITLRHLGPAPLHWEVVHWGAWWWVITACAIVSSAILVPETVSRLFRFRTPNPHDRTAWQGVYAGGCAVAGLLVLINPHIPYVHDRYLLSAMIPLAALTASYVPESRRRFVWMAGWGICILFYAFGIVGLQDYMAWNTARWQAIHVLLDVRHVDPFQIDAGYEYQGMYTSKEYMARNRTTNFHRHGNESKHAGWWVLDDTYAVTFWPREGYEEVARTPYYSYWGRKEPEPHASNWLGMSEHVILTLQRSQHAGGKSEKVK